MKTLLLSSLMLLSFSSFASTVKDPQGELKALFSYLGKPDFERDLGCGNKSELYGSAKATFVTVQSMELTQEIICEGANKILRTTLNSSQGMLQRMAGADSELFTNLEPADLVLDQDAYEADYQEFIFQGLDLLGENLDLTIESVYEGKAYGPNGHKIKAMIVRGNLQINDEAVHERLRSLNVTLYFNKDLPAISRLFQIDIGSGKVLGMNSLKGSLRVVELKK